MEEEEKVERLEPKPGMPRSRRAFIVGTAGALGAIAIQSLAKPLPASAADGDPVLLGTSNSSTNATYIGGGGFAVSTNTAIGVNAFSNSSSGVLGESNFASGVQGHSFQQPGVEGDSDSGDGVWGHTPSGSSANGVHGVSNNSAAGGCGVLGEHKGGGDGVQGTSASGNGIHGVSNDPNENGVGVLGEQKGSSFGVGVAGVAAIGVQGTSNVAGHSGVIGVGTTGVYGQALTGGKGVLAAGAFDGTGLALEAAGDAKFDGKIQAARSGRVNIAYPNKTVSVAVPGGLTASSLVLATLQNSISGIYVASAVPNTGTGKVAINLNKAPGSAATPKTAHVAWFVVS